MTRWLLNLNVYNYKFCYVNTPTRTIFYTGPPAAVTKQQSSSNLSTLSDGRLHTPPLSSSSSPPRAQYVPDFSVKIVADSQYLKINRDHYVAAKRATAMERRGGAADNESTSRDDAACQKEWSRAVITSVNTENSGGGVALEGTEGGAVLKALPSGGVGGGGSGSGSSANRPRPLTSDSVKVEFAAPSCCCDGSPVATVSVVNAQANNQSKTGNDTAENATS